MILTDEEIKIIEEHRKNKKYDFKLLEIKIDHFLKFSNDVIDTACELKNIYETMNCENQKKFERLIQIKFLFDIEKLNDKYQKG